MFLTFLTFWAKKKLFVAGGGIKAGLSDKFMMKLQNRDTNDCLIQHGNTRQC